MIDRFTITTTKCIELMITLKTNRISFPTKIDLKIKDTLQTKMKKLFESKKKKSNSNWSARRSILPNFAQEKF